MKTSRPILTLLCILTISCATWTPAQRSAFLGDVIDLASATATLYGNPGAAAGLNALGVVMQSYVGTGKPIPSKIVAASPGVSTLGTDMAGLISNKVPVNQADVNAIFSAAKLATTAL